MIPPTLIIFYPHEYSKEFQYYQFAVKLDRHGGSCNNYLMTYPIKHVFQMKQKT